MPPRPQIEPTDDWHQIELLARAPGQRSYELIRPVVLFGQSPGERAAESGAAERTLYRQIARFDQLGLAGLVPPPKAEKHRTLPPEVRQTILDGKRKHPALTGRELTRICWARCGHRPSPHTVKRILAEQLFETAHRSPQLLLWARGEDYWLPAAAALPAGASGGVNPTMAGTRERHNSRWAVERAGGAGRCR